MLAAASGNLTAYFRRIWDYRYFWYSLVKADLQRRYRRSFLGLGWSLLTPILMTLVLSSVYQHIMKIPFEEYGPFLMTGLAFWGFFSGSIIQGCNCFNHAEAYIRQEPAPIAIYSLRTVLGVGFHGTIALLLAVGLAATFGGVRSGMAMLSLVPTLIMLVMLAWCCATLIGLVSVYFPDIMYMTEVALQMLYFLTPIMYKPEMLQGTGMAEILLYNPLAIILDLIRTPILHSQVPAFNQYLMMLGFLVSLIAVTVFAVSKLERKLIFEL